MGVFMAASQISMSRHGNKCCCNSAIQCLICPRLHTFDKNLGLNTYKYEYSRGGMVHEKTPELSVRLSRFGSCVRCTVRRMRNVAPCSVSPQTVSREHTYRQ